MSRVSGLDLEQLPTSLRELLAPRVERLGYLGDWFRQTAHQPEALEYFHLFTEALKDALDPRLVEVVALTIAARMDNRYERHQHEQLCRRLGYDDAWVRGLVSVAAPKALTPEEAAVRGLAIGVATNDDALPELLEETMQLLGERTAVAALLLCARYVAHARVAKALSLLPPVPSTVEESQ